MTDDRRSFELQRAARLLDRVLDPGVALPSSQNDNSRPFEVAQLITDSFGVQLRPVTVAPDLDPLSQVRRVLDAAQVRTRPIVLEPGWHHLNAMPMVVTLDSAAAVVVQGSAFEPRLLRVGQPAQRVDDALAARIEPQALEAVRPLPRTVHSLRTLLTWSGTPGRWVIAIGLAGSIAAGLLSLALPLVIDVVFGQSVPTGDSARSWALAAVLALLAVATAAFTYTRVTAAVRAMDSIEISVAGGVLDRVLRLPLSTMRTWSTAELSRRLLIQGPLTDVMNDLLAVGAFAASVALFNAAASLLINPLLGAATIITAVVFSAITALGLRTERRRRRVELTLQDNSDEVVLDLMRGWVPIRVTAGEEFAFARWAEAYARTRTAFLRRWRAEAGFDAARAAVASLGLILLVLAAGSAADIPAGTFLAAITAYSQCLLGLAALAGVMRTVARALPVIDRVQPVLTAEPEDGGEREDPGTIHGALAVRNVGFRYGGDEAWVLRDITFTVEQGSFLAIVGTSGSGKSTLLRLLMGLDQPTTGAISLDGSDLSSLDPRAVRRQFGAVVQSSLLLPGTIRDNLLVCSGPRTDEQIWEALAEVAGDEAVRAMPLGLDTYVDEGSTVISGGQRQRVLLARALLSRPAMVFLDEATSALDNVTQAAVSATIESLTVTRIVIAHRLSTVRRADHIVVLDNGRIVQQGTFEALAAQEGLFREMLERQEL